MLADRNLDRRNAVGILDGTEHVHDVTAIQGLGMVICGASTRALQPGLSHFALTGQPEGGRTYCRCYRLPFRAGCKPGMLQPGFEAREEEQTKTSSDRPAKAKQVHRIPTHHARDRFTSSQNPNHLLPHPEPANTRLNPSCLRAVHFPVSLLFDFEIPPSRSRVWRDQAGEIQAAGRMSGLPCPVGFADRLLCDDEFLLVFS